jgi:drug/metabolite transporter (DMT)-like permease
VTRRGWFALGIAALGWGSGGLATRAAFGEDVGPWTMVALRTLIAGLLVLGLLALNGLRWPDRLTLKVGLVMAVANLLIPYVLFTYAYDEASAGFVGLFGALIPLATAIFANFMLADERLNRGKIIGLIVGFAGVAALLVSGDSGLGADGRPLVAAALAIVSVVAIGYSGGYAKRYAGRYDPMEMIAVQFLASSVVLVPVTLGIEGAPTSLTGTAWALILFMALFSTFLPFYLFYRLLQTVPATTVSLVGYVVPLVALVGGVILLDERIETGILIGGALILAGMIITDRAGRSTRPLVPG